MRSGGIMSAEIDRNTFESLRQMTDGDFVDQLVDTFLEDAPIQIRQMKTFVQTGDAEAFRRAAHSVKSNAATFGAIRLSDLARELETLGKENALEAASDKIDA